MGWGDVFGGIGDVLGGIVGQGDRNEAAGYYDKERQGYEGLSPDIKYSNIASDPESRAAQMDALAQLQNQYRQGGLDSIDKARLNDINTNTNQLAEQNRQAVAQHAMRMGNWNSGNALVSQQMAGQNAANLANNQGVNAAALGQQNRQAAVQGAGQLAGGIGDARDMINRFNAANQVQAQQLSFQNAMARQNGISRGYENQADQANGQADYTRRVWEAGGSAIGGGIDAGTEYFKPKLPTGGGGDTGGDAGYMGAP